MSNRFRKIMAAALAFCTLIPLCLTVVPVQAASHNITDVSSLITSDVVLPNAISVGNFGQGFVTEYNGHDYYFGVCPGGEFVLYDIDAKKQLASGNLGINTVRGICRDGYNNIWVCGNSYSMYKFSLSTLTGQSVRITSGVSVDSFNALGLTWDPVTKKLYYGTYNRGTLNMLDPLTHKSENLAGLIDTSENGKADPDAMYCGFGGLIVKDGYIYTDINGDINMDGVETHEIIKFSISQRKVVDKIDMVANNLMSSAGHFAQYIKLVGNIAFFGFGGTCQKTAAIDISGSKMRLVQLDGDMKYGYASYISDPVNGKSYCFSSSSRGSRVYEIEIATMKTRTLSYDEFPSAFPAFCLDGGSLVTLAGQPGKTFVTSKYNEQTLSTDLVFYNMQSKQLLTYASVTYGLGSGQALTAVASTPDGKTVFTGGFGDGRIAAYDVQTGKMVYYSSDNHQVDSVMYYDGYLYAGNYQSATITQIDMQTGKAVGYMNLQKSPFNQARVHALTAGDNKIFAGMVGDKYRAGGVLTWYDQQKGLTYVAGGPNPEDVFYARTVGVEPKDYVWYSAKTGERVIFTDNDGDGIGDAMVTVNGVQKQLFTGLISNQTIKSMVYKDGYIYGCANPGGGSGAEADPTASSLIFVYDVQAMKVVATLDVRKAFSGYPNIVETMDAIAEDPAVAGKFWVQTSGTLISFTFDRTNNTIKAKEELSISKTAGKAQYHGRSIVFSGEFMYVNIAGYGLCVLERANPKNGYRLTTGDTHAEVILGADNNVYLISGHDIIRLNTAKVIQPFLDTTAAKTVQKIIDALPSSPTWQDAAQISAAREAYNALTTAAKVMVKTSKLVAAENALKGLSAADAVSAQISLIGTVTLESKSAIEAARAAYDALSAQSKENVTNLQVLIEAEATLAQILSGIANAEDVVSKIAAIGTVTANSKTAIEAARAAYENLSDEAKLLVTNLTVLIDAETKLADVLLVADVENKINAIGTVDRFSGTAITEARRAYNDLPAALRGLVTNLSVLTNAESTYTLVLKQTQAVRDVEEKISAIGKVTIERMAAVEVARAAYDKLSEADKALVSNYKVLLQAEQKLQQLRNETDSTWVVVTVVAIVIVLGGAGFFFLKKRKAKEQ